MPAKELSMNRYYYVFPTDKQAPFRFYSVFNKTRINKNVLIKL